MTKRRTSDELRPTLERAKSQLKNALVEACLADIDRADTGELIRVEEVIAIANEAAKEAISVRRRLRSDRASRERDGSGLPAGDQSAAEPTDADPALGYDARNPTLREIDDARGVRWAVFAVYPTTSSDQPAVREGFRAGWLAFDSGRETRRLAPIPSGWRVASDSEILTYLDRAEIGTRRAGNSVRQAYFRPEDELT
ncbi:MAG TPA: hypothetical protein VH277_19190 [Gemmatimonadaceae bacterium]|nr:hypothetical protein [Gemmatimonadaceae bacterium]